MYDNLCDSIIFLFSQPQHFLHHPNVSIGGNAWPAAWKKKSLLVGQSSLPRRIPLHRLRPEHQLPHDWKGSWRRWAWACYWNCGGELMLFSMFHISPGWQKLHGSTGGTRQKVWTGTKILSPNIRYFVAVCLLYKASFLNANLSRY